MYDCIQLLCYLVFLKVLRLSHTGGADPDKAVQYIRGQFLARKPDDKNVYVHVTTATDTDLMKTVLKDVFEILVDMNLKKISSL